MLGCKLIHLNKRAPWDPGDRVCVGKVLKCLSKFFLFVKIDWTALFCYFLKKYRYKKCTYKIAVYIYIKSAHTHIQHKKSSFWTTKLFKIIGYIYIHNEKSLNISLIRVITNKDQHSFSGLWYKHFIFMILPGISTFNNCKVSAISSEIDDDRNQDEYFLIDQNVIFPRYNSHVIRKRFSSSNVRHTFLWWNYWSAMPTSFYFKIVRARMKRVIAFL